MADARLRRCARLNRKADFDRVFAQPEKSAGLYFTVFFRVNPKLLNCPARLGLAVSTKAARSAVARNRIKRLIRESFRLHQQLLKGLDIVVIARPSSAQETDNVPLLEALRHHWRKLSKDRLCARA